jgi:hypothetical protein
MFTYRRVGERARIVPLDPGLQSVLTDLYHLVRISSYTSLSTLSAPLHDFLTTKLTDLESHFKQYIQECQGTLSLDIAVIQLEACITALNLASYILVRHMLLSPDPESTTLVRGLKTYLKAHGSDSSTTPTWESCLGGLLWAYAIGVRFSGENLDRSWFTLQMCRVGHPWALEDWHIVNTSICMVVDGLEHVERFRTT